MSVNSDLANSALQAARALPNFAALLATVDAGRPSYSPNAFFDAYYNTQNALNAGDEVGLAYWAPKLNALVSAQAPDGQIVVTHDQTVKGTTIIPSPVTPPTIIPSPVTPPTIIPSPVTPPAPVSIGFDPTSLPLVGPIVGSLSTALGISPWIVLVVGAGLGAYAFGLFDMGGGASSRRR
jgi:hypothetical protein